MSPNRVETLPVQQVKCRCGNPVKEPSSVPSEDRWFDLDLPSLINFGTILKLPVHRNYFIACSSNVQCQALAALITNAEDHNCYVAIDCLACVGSRKERYQKQGLGSYNYYGNHVTLVMTK